MNIWNVLTVIQFLLFFYWKYIKYFKNGEYLAHIETGTAAAVELLLWSWYSFLRGSHEATTLLTDALEGRHKAASLELLVRQPQEHCRQVLRCWHMEDTCGKLLFINVWLLCMAVKHCAVIANGQGRAEELETSWPSSWRQRFAY